MGRITNVLKALVGYPPFSEGGSTRVFTLLNGLNFGSTSLNKNFSEGFNANVYVYSIINRITNSANSIKLLPELKTKTGTWEVLESGEFHRFAMKPNQEETIYNLLQKALTYYLVTGNNLFYGIKGVGNSAFSEAHVLSPLNAEPKIKTSITGVYADSWKYRLPNKEYPLNADEVKLVKMFNSDTSSIFGMSPLEAGYKTLVASNEIILADASLIKNRGAIGMLSNKGERPLTQHEREATDEALRDSIGGGKNYGSIKTTSGNFDFISFAMSPTDLKILESGVMKLRDLCSIYGVSSKIFNDPNASTFNNVKEDKKDFYNNGVLPPYEQIVEAYNDFIVSSWSKRDGVEYRLRIDYDSIDALQDDLTEKTKGQKNQSEIIINIVSGIGTDWSERSAIEQLQTVLNIDEEKAKILIDKNGVTTENI